MIASQWQCLCILVTHTCLNHVVCVFAQIIQRLPEPQCMKCSVSVLTRGPSAMGVARPWSSDEKRCRDGSEDDGDPLTAGHASSAARNVSSRSLSITSVVEHR